MKYDCVYPDVPGNDTTPRIVPMKWTGSQAYRYFAILAGRLARRPEILSRERRTERRRAILWWRLWKQTRRLPEHLLTPAQRGLLSQSPPPRRSPFPMPPWTEGPSYSLCLPPNLSRKKRLAYYRQQSSQRRKRREQRSHSSLLPARSPEAGEFAIGTGAATQDFAG